MYSITDALLSKINKAKSIEQLKKLQSEAQKESVAPTALEYLLAIAGKHGLDKKAFIKTIIEKSLMERTYVYHLFSGEFGLTRDKLLQFALIGGFTLAETNTLLKYGKMAKLYARDMRDGIIIYCLKEKKSLIETNQTLDDLGHEILK